MYNMKQLFLVAVGLLLWTTACKNESSTEPANKPVTTEKPKPRKTVKVPAFDVDAAYNFIKEQVDFGPRVPGTPPHENMRKWLVRYFKDLGFRVIEQNFDAYFPDGKKYRATNIIASYNPQHTHRIMLAAHWDTRYIADQDPKDKSPILGADDGGSGVGILMSIAKTLKEHPADIGVDFVFFDAEDQGKPEGGSDDDGTSWCQGSQYWATNLQPPGYRPQFGVLLDMVGAKNAQFQVDEVSSAYAGEYASKLWNLARNIGYSQYFLDGQAPALIDDHLFVNRMARIPMLNIINRKNINGEYLFGDHWHTQADNLKVIDKRSLRAVGQSLTAMIYHASAGNF